MAQAERRFLSLSPQAARTLDELSEFEGISGSAAVERSLETRFGLIDLASRIPRDERGRLVRMAVLPEGVPAPRGAEVFRLWLPVREPEVPQVVTVDLPDADDDAVAADVD